MTRSKSGGRGSEVQTTLLDSIKRTITTATSSLWGTKDDMEFQLAHQHENDKRISSSTTLGNRRKAKGKASEVIDVSSDEGGVGPSTRPFPKEKGEALIKSLKERNKTQTQPRPRRSAPGPTFTPGRNTLEKEKARTPVQSSRRQSLGSNKSSVDRSRDPLKSSTSATTWMEHDLGPGWHATQSVFATQPQVRGLEQQRLQAQRPQVQAQPGPSTQRQRPQRKNNDHPYASPDKFARYQEVDHEDPHVSVLDGLPPNPPGEHDNVSSKRHQRSSSPQRLASPVKGPTPKPAAYQYRNYVASHQHEEPEEAVDDPIKDADGDSDVEFVDRPKVMAPPSDGKRTVQPQSSPTRPPQKPKPLLGKMQKKEPTRDTLVQTRGKNVIQSSNLKSSKITAPPSHATADVEYARLFLFEQYVPADMISITQKYVGLCNRSGGQRHGKANITWPCVTDVMVYDGIDNPLLIFTAEPSKDNVAEDREVYHSLTAFMSVPSSDPDDWTIKLFVAFKSGSSEAQTLMKLATSICKRRSIPVRSLDDSAALTVRKANLPLPRPEFRVNTKAAQAAADRRREEQLTASRSTFESSSTGRAGPSKGKGKAMEEDPTQSKLSFSTTSGLQGSLRRSNRKAGNPAYSEVDEDDESVAPKISAIPPLAAEERNKLLFEYPISGRAEVQITGGDRYRVQSDDFLNDTLILFGLRNVIQGLCDPAKSRVHLLNSFFYEKITSKKGKVVKNDEKWPAWPAYDTVKKWTKNADIFNKDWIVVPINENLHWYLAVIYNPAGILRETGPEADDKASAPPSGSNSPSRRSSGATLAATHEAEEAPPDAVVPDNRPARENEALDFNESDLDELTDNEFASHKTRLQKSSDPLDCIDEDEGIVRAGVENMTIDPNPPPSSPIGRSILTPSMMAAEAQNAAALERASGQSSPAKEAVNEAEKRAKEAEKPEKTSLPPKPDLNIWNSGDCWIFTFDSLGGGHRSVAEYLNRWLRYEARDKQVLKEDANPSVARYSEARVPTQPNFHDCGLYMIHFCKQLLENSEEVVRFMQRTPPRGANSAERKAWEEEMALVWHKQGTDCMRREFIELIDGVAAEYRSIVGDRPVRMAGNQEEEEDELPDQSDLEVVNVVPSGAIDIDGQATATGADGQGGPAADGEATEATEPVEQLDDPATTRIHGSPSPPLRGRAPIKVQTSVEPDDVLTSIHPPAPASTTPDVEPGPDIFNWRSPTQYIAAEHDQEDAMAHANVGIFSTALHGRGLSPSVSDSDDIDIEMASKSTATVGSGSRDGTSYLDNEAPSKPAGYREQATPSRAHGNGNSNVLVESSSLEESPFNIVPFGSNEILDDPAHEAAPVADDEGRRKPSPELDFESLPPREDVLGVVSVGPRSMTPLGEPSGSAGPFRRDSHDSLSSSTDSVQLADKTTAKTSPAKGLQSSRVVSPKRPSQGPPKSSPHQASVTYLKRQRTGRGVKQQAESSSSSPHTRSRRGASEFTTLAPVKRQKITHRRNKEGRDGTSVSMPIEVDDDE